MDQIYPDEALELTKKIRNRVNSDYLIQLAIASNPWAKNPKALATAFESQIEKEYELGDEEPDHAAIQNLKGKLGKSKQIKVK